MSSVHPTKEQKIPDNDSKQPTRLSKSLQEALADYEAALATIAQMTDSKDCRQPNQLKLAIALNNLAISYGPLENNEKKLKMLKRSLKIFKNQKNRRLYISEMASILINLANIYGALGDTQKKCSILESTLVIKEALHGSNHLQLTATLNNLGIVYGSLKKFPEQRKMFERALTIKEAHYGPNDPELAFSLAHLAVVYRKLEQHDMALTTAQRTYQILMNHPEYRETHPEAERLIAYLTSAGKFTLQNLQGATQAMASTAATPSSLLGTTQPLSQHGFLASNSQQQVEAQQKLLGRAVLDLITAINTQRATPQSSDLSIPHLVAQIISALAKSKAHFEYLYSNPTETERLIPKTLAEFILKYVKNDRALMDLSTTDKDFSNFLKHQLIHGHLQALYDRFQPPKPDEKQENRGNRGNRMINNEENGKCCSIM